MPSPTVAVVGRFAPTPSGPLHAGSLVAALASWLDARAAGGRWLLRLEDADGARCDANAAACIVQQLASLGLLHDGAVLTQACRGAVYAAAAQRLLAAGWAYPCACTRADIQAAMDRAGQPHEPHRERVYPGTCRHGLGGRRARALRFDAHRHGLNPLVHWTDRRHGPQRQHVAQAAGDFVLHRADGVWAYQLAVVVDDAEQGVTSVVRGDDLLDNTARQIMLQGALHLPQPSYLHTPLVRAADGAKLSKSHGAAPLQLPDAAAAVRALGEAGAVLGLPDATATSAATPQLWLQRALPVWAGIIQVWAARCHATSPSHPPSPSIS